MTAGQQVEMLTAEAHYLTEIYHKRIAIHSCQHLEMPSINKIKDTKTKALYHNSSK